MKILCIIIGSVILRIALAFSFVRVSAVQDARAIELEADASTIAPDTVQQIKSLWQYLHFIWAAIAQLFNTSAQGGTWVLFINYGIEKMGFAAEQASFYFVLSIVMMMIGRFMGTYLMQFIAPNKLLTGFALGNVLMCLIVAQSFGWPSFIALLMLNFFLSIMFPTIFSFGLKGMGDKTQQASSFSVMGVVCGALFPPLMGQLADTDVATAYYLSIICYVDIFLFGVRLYKIR